MTVNIKMVKVNLSPAVKGTKVGSGSTSAQVTHLPSFAVENTSQTVVQLIQKP